jgi:argininosuccinate lyase
MAEKLWDGRFSEKTDVSVETFTASIDVDKRLYDCDIDGSIAHCRMLARSAIISEADAEAIVEGLEKIRQEIRCGRFAFDNRLEDIHMHIESRLAEIVGDAARKLHTARSRNDQVALDIRMYLREETRGILTDLLNLRKVIVALAAANLDIVMAGYTHTQRAQPVLLSHHLMAYYEMLTRDSERFYDCGRRIDVCPLGAAALAGTTYPIDRRYSAALLKFSKVSENSIDSVSDRDFLIEFSAASAICMVHLSRLSEELILWSSAEFGFIELPDAFATGSSIMPQKKNPDVPELVRGKTGRVFGNLTALLTMMKSLPLSYNRDMQEDKEPVFDTIDTLGSCIRIYTKLLPKLKIKKETMRRSAESGFLNATDLADYLVSKGIPFREAHACVGRAVGYAISQNKELDALSLDELKSFSDRIESDVFAALTPEQMIRRRKSLGGTARANVKRAVLRAGKAMQAEAGRISGIWKR